MKKKIVLLIIIAFSFNGCSYDVVRNKFESKSDFYNRVNKACENETNLTIKTTDNKAYKGRNVYIEENSIHFISEENEESVMLPVFTVQQIYFEDSGNSIFEGLLFGALGGGFLSTIVSTDTHDYGKGLGILLGITVGAVAGIIYGSFNPTQTVIIIN